MSKLDNNFGMNLKRLRLSHNPRLSLRALSALTGLSNGYLSQLETNPSISPTFDTIIALAKGFNLTVEQFLSVTGLIEFPETPRANHEKGTSLALPVIGIPVYDKVYLENQKVIIESCERVVYTNVDCVTSGASYFWFQVNNNCMSPEIKQGDLVLVKVVEDCDSNSELYLVDVNQKDFQVMRIIKNDGMYVFSTENDEYPTMMQPQPAGKMLSVIGQVIEVRRCTVNKM